MMVVVYYYCYSACRGPAGGATPTAPATPARGVVVRSAAPLRSGRSGKQERQGGTSCYPIYCVCPGKPVGTWLGKPVFTFGLCGPYSSGEYLIFLSLFYYLNVNKLS